MLSRDPSIRIAIDEVVCELGGKPNVIEKKLTEMQPVNKK